MSNSRRAVPIAAVAAVAAVCLAWGVYAQEEPPVEHAMTPEMAAEMAAWQKAMTPGPQHEALAAMAGEWDIELTMWMQPGAEAVPMVATASRRMIFDGRFLEEDVRGEFMGRPFLGRGVTGYDNVTGKWWSTWIDNQTTSLMAGEGDWDQETNVGTILFRSSDPVSGAERQMKGITRIHSADHEVHEMWEERGGETYKSMELVYRRR